MKYEKNINILMVITNLGAGGAQRVFYDHALAFSNKYNIEEIVFDNLESERIYNSGLPLHSLNINAARNPLQKISFFFKRAKSLKSIIVKTDANLVISHMDGANWVNALSGTKAKKILVVHGTVLHDESNSAMMQWIRRKLIIPYLYNKADMTVAVSEGIENELRNFCNVKNACSIPNFFDVEKIVKASKENLPEAVNELFDSHQVLITSGRLHEQKKQRYLFPIYLELKKKFANLKLVVLGDGPLRENLIDDASVMGMQVYDCWNNKTLNDKYDVFFFGYVNNPFAYLSRSTLFLFPSGWEGFPMALCEAMISGVPVLTADCPTGPRQILQPGSFDENYSLNEIQWTENGVLLPMPGKTNFLKSWVIAASELLSDKQKSNQLINAAQKRMQDFDKPKVLDQWFTLINKVISQQ